MGSNDEKSYTAPHNSGRGGPELATQTSCIYAVNLRLIMVGIKIINHKVPAIYD